MTPCRPLRPLVAVACALAVIVGSAATWADAPGGGHGRLDAALFFRASQLGPPRISPSGDYVAFLRRTRDDRWKLVVLHLESESWDRLDDFRSTGNTSFAWGDDRTLIVRTPSGNSLVRVGMRDGALKTRTVNLTTTGVVVDPLPMTENKFLLGVGKAVYHVDIRASFKRADARRNTRGTVVARHDERVIKWVPDVQGRVRGAVTLISPDDEAPRLRLWVREHVRDDWRLISEWESQLIDAEGLTPLGFTADGERLLVSTNRGRDTYALYEMDVTTGELLRLVYEHPSAEIEAVAFDYAGEALVGVWSFEGGVYRVHYFEASMQRHQRLLEKALPDREAVIYDVNRDEDVFVVLAWGPRHPGAFYAYDSKKKLAVEIGSVAPWLESSLLAEVTAFEVRAPGGPRVEAFLTRPSRPSGVPALIVMPHGGPIGVRDDLGFDPVSQYLAHQGFAVLRVNYRGSSGYGRAFERAGHGERGGGIEDDIDAAIDHVVEQGWADGDRIALFGASYGGYSALMSAVRHPKRFRCAVTWMGVSDLLLRLSNAQKGSALVAEAVSRISGGSDLDPEELIRKSPVYRASEIKIPVLIVHGDRDANVDVEHAYRLKLMLEKHGNVPRWMIMEGYGHWMPDEAAAAVLFRRIHTFLYYNTR